MAAPLSPEDASIVLRRAAALDAVAQTSGPLDGDGLDESVLRDAAREVGLSDDAVDQAVAEWRRGQLAVLPELAAARRLGLPGQVVVDRVLSGPPELVAPALERWLRGQWFEPRRVHGETRDWTPRTGAMARARRAADVQGRLRLRDANRLRVRVLPAGGGARVVLVAELGDLRRGLLAGLVAAPGVVVTAGVGAALLIGPGAPEALLALPAGLLTGGAGWTVARLLLALRLGNVSEEVEVALDRLLAAPPAGALPAWMPAPISRWVERRH